VIKVTPRKTGLELTFLGTRGEIKIRSRPHQRHSSLLVEHDGARIMIDCGTDWLGRLTAVAPTAIVLTHAHPDHAGGLAQGAPCPLYATRETLRLVRRFPIRDRRSMPLKKSVAIGGLRFKAYRVQHSIRAPAVGYRVSTKAGSFFYVPDVARLPNIAEALGGVGVYIGDGATMRRSMVRVKERTLIGHAPITTQLDWCARAHLHRAIFTHCGSPIVRGDPRALDAIIRSLGRECGIDARLARDGDRLSFPGSDGSKGSGVIELRKRTERAKQRGCRDAYRA
jgi:phosphoribosyl 1,2-cyclic phosphodiesterase